MLGLAIVLAALAALGGVGGGVASADCTTGGSGCLPGSGYSLDTVWNCGPTYYVDNCYANGTTNSLNSVSHTFGWGSASFSGVNVCIRLGSFVGACAPGLARVCWQANCNDQNSTAVRAWVFHLEPGIAWRVSGHAKA